MSKTFYDVLIKETKTEKSKISLDEGVMPISPFIAYVAFKKRVFNAFKNNKIFQAFRALKSETMKLKGKAMVGAEKTKATAGGTSKDTVYRFTPEQIQVMADIYNKYGKKLVNDILEFRRNVLAPYQVIKRLIKSSSRVAPKDVTGISREDYEAAVESGKKKIAGRGDVYFQKVEDIRSKLDSINSQVENLQKLRKDFSGSTPMIDYNIVNKVFKKFDIGESPEGYSREELKRVYDEIMKNYKVLLSASQQQEADMEDYAKMKELRQRQRQLWQGKTVDLTKTASSEFFKKGSFNVALAKYFFAREIISQLTRPASVFNVFKKTYVSIIGEMIDKYLQQRKELLDDLGSMKGKAQFTDKESKVYSKLPHIKHFSQNEKDYYLKVKPEDFPTKTVNIPRSQELIDAERKIENEIKKFEHSLKQVVSPEDFEKLRRYRVIGNLISVKELREPDDLFKSKEEIIGELRDEPVEEATNMETQCAWCKKIKRDGKWVEEAPKEGMPITHGICPECAEKFKAEKKEVVEAVVVSIGSLLYDDYEKRGVFPFIDKIGKITLTPAQVQELIDDAKYQTDQHGPDEIPVNYKKAYARLLQQLISEKKENGREDQTKQE
jgi:hypothetical protein